MFKITGKEKAVMAFIGTIATWGATAFADGSVSTGELFGLVAVVLATGGVYQVKNSDS